LFPVHAVDGAAGEPADGGVLVAEELRRRALPLFYARIVLKNGDLVLVYPELVD